MTIDFLSCSIPQFVHYLAVFAFYNSISEIYAQKVETSKKANRKQNRLSTNISIPNIANIIV